MCFQVESYVNPERLHPKFKGVDAWIIGVAVSAGLLLLLLLILLLWWVSNKESLGTFIVVFIYLSVFLKIT